MNKNSSSQIDGEEMESSGTKETGFIKENLNPYCELDCPG